MSVVPAKLFCNETTPSVKCFDPSDVALMTFTQKMQQNTCDVNSSCSGMHTMNECVCKCHCVPAKLFSNETTPTVKYFDPADVALIALTQKIQQKHL